MRAGATGVVPSGDPLLEPWLRDDLDIVTFGPDGDVAYEGSASVPGAPRVVVAGGERIELELPFDQRHNLLNALAAVAAARAIGVHPGGRVDVRFSSLRGERVALGIGVLVINDCYNANPLSMRAALDDLASQHAEGRRVAVLGDMLELGPAERDHHREIGAYAASAGVDLLVTARGRRRCSTSSTGSRTPCSTPGRRPRCSQSSSAPATSCSSRRREASGSRS